MKQCWRWFGDHDVVHLQEIEQAGATGIVTALHHIENGAVWPVDEIEKRKNKIAMRETGKPSTLNWEVVESLPVSEDIKKQDGAWREHLANYRESLENLASCGIKTVCYNFMPVLDWTRTDLRWRLENGATCMRFDLTDFAAFDLFILKREGAEQDFTQELVEAARERFSTLDEGAQKRLTNNIVAGLPGANQNLTLDAVRELLSEYEGIDEARLRGNMTAFLEEVVPTAQRLGMRLCCHPDDPPFPLLGLPRILSTEADYEWLTSAVKSPSNGITLCSGSLGAHVDNDLPGMMKRMGEKVHFLHLRNVSHDALVTPGSFYEDEHLAGHTDMVALIAAILDEEDRRKSEGRDDWQIPMRPDHGQDILDDLKRDAQPGYPAIGRLKGLAELRGVETALSSLRNAKP